jgi:hypothetical protein
MLITMPPDLLPRGEPIRWKEVDLSLPDFPQVVTPGETQRILGILDAQNDNLRSENLRLRGELELIKASGDSQSAGLIPDGFNLQQHLLAKERAYHELALSHVDDNAAAAARLLGLPTAYFSCWSGSFRTARSANTETRKLAMSTSRTRPQGLRRNRQSTRDSAETPTTTRAPSRIQPCRRRAANHRVAKLCRLFGVSPAATKFGGPAAIARTTRNSH